jgi:hypothetical protein
MSTIPYNDESRVQAIKQFDKNISILMHLVGPEILRLDKKTVEQIVVDFKKESGLDQMCSNTIHDSADLYTSIEQYPVIRARNLLFVIKTGDVNIDKMCKEYTESTPNAIAFPVLGLDDKELLALWDMFKEGLDVNMSSPKLRWRFLWSITELAAFDAYYRKLLK